MKIYKKKIYVGMSADLLHHGHLNLLKQAKKYGDIIIGLLTDKAIASYKRLPFLNYNDRLMLLKNIKGIKEIIPQDTLDYTKNLKLLKPEFVIHGDDWKKGIQKKIRLKVIKTISKWKGKIIEIPYTKGISSTELIKEIKANGIDASQRKKNLRRLLSAKKLIRILQVHDPISAIIAEETKVETKHNINEFDAMWDSSVSSSLVRGKPDIEVVDLTARANTINDIFEVTTKPLIYDADSGGKIDYFGFAVKTLDRIGVSAVIIEDKVGIKKNSLLGSNSGARQDTIKNFSKKIKHGKKNQISQEFMIIARIESLILGNGMKDAIKRGFAYSKAGADGIMIHSTQKNPKEIFEFIRIFRKKFPDKYIFIAPTTFNKTSEKNFMKNNVNGVIYANHMIRSAIPAMTKTAQMILKDQNSFNASNKFCISIKELLNLRSS
jgi:phosphoenolpyruvate mutase